MRGREVFEVGLLLTKMEYHGKFIRMYLYESMEGLFGHKDQTHIDVPTNQVDSKIVKNLVGRKEIKFSSKMVRFFLVGYAPKQFPVELSI